MGGSIVIGKPTGSQNGKPVARESLADVLVRASGGKAQEVSSRFMISPDNNSVSLSFIGLDARWITRWERDSGFRNLMPDGTPDERAVAPNIIYAFKRLLARDAKTDENLRAFVEANPELKI